MTDANQRIEAALARLGEEHEPPAGWEQRVLDAVRAPPARRPWWRYAAPGFALAAAAAVAVILVARPAPAPLALRVDRAHGKPMRGDEVVVGSVLQLQATGGSGRRAISVYRNGQLVLRCPGAPRCRTIDDGLAVDLTVSLIGTYKIVALSQLPDGLLLTDSYDVDFAAVRQAGLGADDVREDSVPVM